MNNSNRNNPNKNKYAHYAGNQKNGYQYNEYGSAGTNDYYQNKSYNNGGNNQGNDMYGYGEYMNYSEHSPQRGQGASNNYSEYNYNNLGNNNGNNNYNNYGANNYGVNGYGANNYSANANNYGSNNNYNSGSTSYDNLSNNNYNNLSNNSNYNNLDNNYSANANNYGSSATNYSTEFSYTTYGANDYDKTAYNEGMYDGGGPSNSDVEITVLTPAKSHVVMEAIISIVLCVFIGTVFGKLLTGVFSDYWNKHIANENFLDLIINVVGILLIVVASYFLHIILHELGHLIGGTLSNYSLISFRIFSIVLTKENRKTTVKKYNVPNTVGECVMMPPEVKNGKYPYKMYRIGGVALNVIASVAAIAVVFGVKAISKYPWDMWGAIFAVVGVIVAINNGVPMMIGGVPNDGYLLLHMSEHSEASLAVHSQLLIHAFLSKGGCYSEVPYEQFCISRNGEIKNYLVARIKLLEYRWHLEHLDFTQAAKCLEATNQYFNSLPKMHQYEINSEKMFVEIMCENDREVIDKLYNTDVERFVTEIQNVLTRNRILMAYEAGVKKDTRTAGRHYAQLKNNVKIYPIKGEAELELMLADYIYERFCSK